MKYISYYNSPLGKILLASDEIGLFGAWFENQKYYADIDVSNERMTINLTDEEGHVLSFNLSQSEVHYVLHMVERRLNSFMRDDGGGGFGDED